MARLTTKERKALPKGDFALPGGRYPVPDESHAKNALARVSQFGSSEEKRKVRAKVHAKYPDIEISGGQHMPQRAPEERASRAKNHH